MRIATAKVMNEIDKYCIETLKIPGIVLMENAALKVLKQVNVTQYKNYVIVCGKGNNGGDGLALARHLFVLGKNIEVFSIGESDKMSQEYQINKDILKNMGISIHKVGNMQDTDGFREAINRSDIVIDAIFGTGLQRKVEGIFDSVISIINENSSYIIAIDIPSGMNTDTGEILGNCIKANKTVTLGLYKKGFINYGTEKYTGEVIVEDIGIPKIAIDKIKEQEYILDKAVIVENMMRREKYGHKGEYGRAFIIAGSNGFSGAAYIATQGAVKSGAGLVAVCSDKAIVDILSIKVTEAMTIPFEEKERVKEWIAKSNAIAIGPGLGRKEDTLEKLKMVIDSAECPIVIDADGITMLKKNLDLLKEKHSSIILTPHLGEMSTLTGLSIEEIKKNRIEVAKQFAQEYEVIVLLKGYNTIITDGETTFINPTGNSAMASGGMGDCLTGVITSFLAQGYSPMKATVIAAYLHGYCGERLSDHKFTVVATDIVEEIPFVIKEFHSLT